MFYDRFIALCAEKSITPSAAAERAGFSKSLVTKWKSNGTVLPSPDVLEKLSKFFGISISNLLGEEDKKNKPTTVAGDELTEAELNFILELRKLPEEKREAFLKFLGVD